MKGEAKPSHLGRGCRVEVGGQEDRAKMSKKDRATLGDTGGQG